MKYNLYDKENNSLLYIDSHTIDYNLFCNLCDNCSCIPQ